MHMRFCMSLQRKILLNRLDMDPFCHRPGRARFGESFRDPVDFRGVSWVVVTLPEAWLSGTKAGFTTRDVPFREGLRQCRRNP